MKPVRGSAAMALVAIGFSVLCMPAAYAVTMDMVKVGNPGNTADPATGSVYGAVASSFMIGKYDVTIQQYTTFLNSVAASDPHGLYNESMAFDLAVAGIKRAGTDGSYTYSVIGPSGATPAGASSPGNRPITNVSWFDAARFANWMQNGQGSGDTETGAYTLNGATTGFVPVANSGAMFYIPTEDQWYKAAYYSPLLNSGSGGYFVYATQSNIAPGNTIGGSENQANWNTEMIGLPPGYSVTQFNEWDPNQNYLTDVGAFTNSASYYGTFDQNGNVFQWLQWNELDAPHGSGLIRGGYWNGADFMMASSFVNNAYAPFEKTSFIGFRLASPDSLFWNTTTGTWNTTNTVWTTGTGGTLAFSNGDSVTFSGTGGGVVTISGSLQPSSITVSVTSGTYTFVSSAGNLLTGTTGLAKSGGGTLILSGSNGFTGATAVTGGALLVNGVLSSTTTTVSGGLLGGSGTVSGAVQLAAGGTIAPGAAQGGTGILTLNSLSGTGGTFAMDITGTGAGQYDRLTIGGNLDYLGNTLQISMSGTYANGTAWDLFDFTTQSGTLAGISPIVADSAYNARTWGLATSSSSTFDQRYGAGIWLSSWGSNGQRFIFNQADGVLTVVPEPSTFVMAGAGIAGFALLRWRRTRRRAGDAAAKPA